MNIGIVSGSGFYDFPELEGLKKITVKTVFGEAELSEAVFGSHNIYFIARHGVNHRLLPNMINYRANIGAMKEKGVELIISTSIMGILNENIPLAELLFFDDLYYPDNRLPDGEICSMFTVPGSPGRGHYIFGSPFSAKANTIAENAASGCEEKYTNGLTHCHASGPRFNSKSEIKAFQGAGCSTVSQTVGPEVILAGECEIAYCLLGFGVDYANGVKDEPTPIEILNNNMETSRAVFKKVIKVMLDKLENQSGFFDRGFVYRFE